MTEILNIYRLGGLVGHAGRLYVPLDRSHRACGFASPVPVRPSSTHGSELLKAELLLAVGIYSLDLNEDTLSSSSTGIDYICGRFCA